jgi:4,4'-diaponeurosporenoate glycosyltransferase
MFDVTPSMVAVVLFTVGWVCGWGMLCRPRKLPSTTGDRRTVSVVVPARDEAHAIAGAVTAMVRQCRPGDEVIVVDDGSTDGTGEVAARAGARVVRAAPPPNGWAGKTHACATGAAASAGALLVFMDADVVPGPTSSTRWRQSSSATRRSSCPSSRGTRRAVPSNSSACCSTSRR